MSQETIADPAVETRSFEAETSRLLDIVAKEERLRKVQRPSNGRQPLRLRTKLARLVG